MFRTVPLSIIRNFLLYTQQWYMSYRFADSSRAGSVPSWSCSQAVSKPVWHISLLCVQWRTPDDGQRNCPKHAEFYSKNKFEKLMHLVGFIISIHSVLCLTTGPKPLPKRVQLRVRYSASSFNFLYPIFSLRPSSSSFHTRESYSAELKRRIT